ncbi:MAG: spore coat-associated protein [Acidimicrobiaceae bacterium]|jgi:spore coat-associated protein N
MKRVFGSTSKKVLLSLGALGVAAGIASLGTFATFTSTTSASQTVSSGTVTIALGATGAATNRLTVNASGLVPGDTVQRSFDLTNSGSQNLASIGLTTTASPSSLLDSDGTNGLQMVVDKCSIAWVEVGTSPAFTYTCAGTTTTVIASRAVIGSGLNMASLAALTSGGTDHLRVTLTLPSTTGNTFQGLSSTVTYSFLGTQRTATNQ